MRIFPNACFGWREVISVHACQLDGIICIFKYQLTAMILGPSRLKSDHIVLHYSIDDFFGSLMLVAGP